MLKEFRDLFDKKNLLDLALERSYQMLTDVGEMFDVSVSALRQSDAAADKKDIRRRDKLINRYEREVRRHVFIHMVMNKSDDPYTALVLLNIVIDLERMGDYTKNIMELAIDYPDRLDGGPYEDDIVRMETDIAELLKSVENAFRESDSDKALEILKGHRWIAPRCDEINSELIRENKDVNSRTAVAVALYVRYLKRVSAHALNIASSIVNPFGRIGFLADEEIKP